MVEAGFLSAKAHAKAEAESSNGKFDGAHRKGGNKNVRLGHGLLHELVPAHVIRSSAQRMAVTHFTGARKFG